MKEKEPRIRCTLEVKERLKKFQKKNRLATHNDALAVLLERAGE